MILIEATEVLGRWEKKKKKRLHWGEAPWPARAGWAVLKFVLSGPLGWAGHGGHGSFETQTL